jgi:hypothetical protein
MQIFDRTQISEKEAKASRKSRTGKGYVNEREVFVKIV